MTSQLLICSPTIAAALWPVAADAAFKAAIILLLAWAATLIMHRDSAAMRHLVWTLAVCGSLVLPALSATLPGWRILPTWMDPQTVSIAPVSAPAAPPTMVDVDRREFSPPQTDEAGRSNDFGRSAAIPHAAGDTDSVAPPAASRSLATPPVAPPRAPAPRRERATWQSWALIAWGCGTAFMLLPLLFSLAGLWHLGRQSARISDGSWERLLGELTTRLNLRQSVTLLRGRRKGMPMTWGIVRPKLLLPPEADGWATDRRRVVLMHELAHIRRGDFLTQLIVHFARAVYWFNPLLWMASRRIAIESEGACDDLVLTQETKASDYAEHLLTVAAGLTAGMLPVTAVAMARSSRLEGRLLAILDADRNRRTVTVTAILTATILLAGALLPLAMVRAADRENQRNTASGTTNPILSEKGAASSTEFHSDVLEAQLKQARAEALTLEKQYKAGLVDTLTMQAGKNKVEVLEAELTGDPMKVAEVRLVCARRQLETITKLYNVGMVTHLDVDRAKGDVDIAEARVREAAAQASHASANGTESPPSIVNGAVPGELSGTVTDEAGKPLAGVLAHVWTWCPGEQTTTDEKGHFILRKLGAEPVEIRFSKADFSPWYNPVQPTGVAGLRVKLTNKTYFEGVVETPDGKPVKDALVRAASSPKHNPAVEIGSVWTETNSDGNGHYRLYVAPDTYAIHVRVPKVGTARLQQTPIAEGDARKLDIKLTPGITFNAIAVDRQSGLPIHGVLLAIKDRKGAEDTSDRDGKIAIDGMSPGSFAFVIQASGYLGRSPQGNFNYWESELTDGMAPFNIELERVVRITGVVQDPDGNPVAGATVAPADGTGNSLTGDTSFSVPTAKDGTFVIELPASGKRKYNIEAHDGNQAQWRKWANGILPPIQTKPGDELKNVVINLTRPATVRGHMKDETGKPLVDRQVRASAADLLENRYYDPTTTTDKNGNFELRFIRPGNQYIQAAPFFWCNVVPSDGMTLKLKQGETNSQLVTLKEGEIKTGVELTAPASTAFPSDEEQLHQMIERSERAATKAKAQGAAAAKPSAEAGPINATEPQPTSKPSDRAAERAAKMKADIKNFTLDLQYSGEQDKPFYRLQLTVAPIAARERTNPFDRQTQITEDQAKKIIDYLAGEGFLDKAFSLHDFQFIPKATQPGYSLKVMDYYSDLGWNLPMLKRLDGLKSALDGDAATNMDFLVGRLSGYRKQWTKDGAGKQ